MQTYLFNLFSGQPAKDFNRTGRKEAQNRKSTQIKGKDAGVGCAGVLVPGTDGWEGKCEGRQGLLWLT